MMLSEEEARGKWCPFARSLVYAVDNYGNQSHATSCNRNINGQPSTACLGSACMSWRWQGWKVQGAILPQQNPPEEKRVGPRLGYCGLAGEPSPYGAP